MLLLIPLSSSALFHSHEERSFLAHLRTHSLIYTGPEYHLRFGIYLANSQWIREFNAADHSFTVELNHLATYTPAELSVLRGAFFPSDAQRREMKRPVRGAVPASVDWRDQNVVQVVKNQGQCGSCWAFGSIAAQESAWAIHTGQLYNLSEQNLVDCVVTNRGCNGGWIDTAYYWVYHRQNGYFNTEANYPYTAKDGKCAFSAADSTTYVVDWAYVSKTEAALQAVVATYGPVAVIIDASKKSFNAYKSGIYNEKSCATTNGDHVVTAIGYGTSAGTDYWLVKNSWGTTWGEKGFIRMSRNANNQCGIASAACLPFVTDE
jgi:cathepsin L